MTKIEHEEYHKTTITIGNKDSKEPIIVQLPKIKRSEEHTSELQLLKKD